MRKSLLSFFTLFIAAGSVSALAQFTLSAGVQSATTDIESELKRSIHVPASGGGGMGTTIFIDESENNNSTGIGGEIAAGYQFNYSSELNLALEVFGQVLNTEVETPVIAQGTGQLILAAHLPGQDATTSFDWIAGLRARPGYYVTPSTRLFIDAGVVWGGFELKYTQTLQEYINDLFASDFSQTETETLFGMRYGAGIEFKFTPNLVVGVDYTITQFEEFESDTATTVANLAQAKFSAGNVAVSASSEYTPTLHTAGLNFKYLFGTNRKARHPKPMIDK